jgi:hypothetical protein
MSEVVELLWERGTPVPDRCVKLGEDPYADLQQKPNRDISVTPEPVIKDPVFAHGSLQRN